MCRVCRQVDPVLHGVVTRMRMCFDSVHCYGGKEKLFHHGLFMDQISAQDAKPTEFRADVNERFVRY